MLHARLTKELVTDADWSTALDAWRRLRDSHELSTPASSASELTFSVKCYRTGTKTKASNSSAIQAHVGGDLAERFGWCVDLKSPLLTVLVYVSDKRWVLGVSVLR